MVGAVKEYKANHPDPFLLKIIALAYGADAKNLNMPLNSGNNILFSLGKNVRALVNTDAPDSEYLKIIVKEGDYFFQHLNTLHKVEFLTDESCIKSNLKDYFFASGTTLFITPYGGWQRIISPLSENPKEPPKKTLGSEEMIEELHALKDIKNFDTILLAELFSESEDRGIFNLQPYLRSISKNFKAIVGVYVSPPAKPEWIEWAYAVGVDFIWYDLLCYHRDYSDKLPCRINYNRTIESLNHAVEVFPKGCVFTSLLAGLESSKETVEGINYFLSRGITPVIRTAPSYPVPLDELLILYRTLGDGIKSKGLDGPMMNRMDHLLTPNELLRHSLGGRTRIKNFVDSFTTLMKNSAVRNIYKLRRNLKVKEVK